MRLAFVVICTLVIAGAVFWVWRQAGQAQAMPRDQFDALYEAPAPTSATPRRVFHLGHSLVARDMPAMLAQLAPDGHNYESQLGWGTPLKAHWEPDVAINGFDEENDHPRYRDAKDALAAGTYDAIVLTEMVEIRDAIQYHNSPHYLARWAEAAWDANPDAQLYLYETWHRLDDSEGWLERLDQDRRRYWEDQILRPALGQFDPPRPIYVIPAGQVMARFVREVEARSGIGEVGAASDLFTDDIHLNDLGSYLVALTHYAVLYQQSPVGHAFDLNRADGSPADVPTAEVAQLMQEIVWEVVQGDPMTGIHAPIN